jgi:hypothetical protein
MRRAWWEKSFIVEEFTGKLPNGMGLVINVFIHKFLVRLHGLHRIRALEIHSLAPPFSVSLEFDRERFIQSIHSNRLSGGPFLN